MHRDHFWPSISMNTSVEVSALSKVIDKRMINRILIQDVHLNGLKAAISRRVLQAMSQCRTVPKRQA